MKLDELFDYTASQLENMSDEQLMVVFLPYLPVCVPKAKPLKENVTPGTTSTGSNASVLTGEIDLSVVNMDRSRGYKSAKPKKTREEKKKEDMIMLVEALKNSGVDMSKLVERPKGL